MIVVVAPSSAAGVHRPPLRSWQRAALELYRASAGPDFLLTATPGSGKTAFALTVAEQLLDARQIDRIIVVAPTDHLRTQWSRAASAAGIGLDPALPNSVGPVRADLRGYVTTYAQVAAHPLLHRARTEARRTLVVLDEIHHAGDGLSWGDAVAEAFGPARRRIALTGTPFRTRSDERIPFVRYVADPVGPAAPTETGRSSGFGDPAVTPADQEPLGEGELRSVADYHYGYREALADGVVRPVVFAAYTGIAHWRNNAGEVISASLSEPATRQREATAWRTALDPRGRWVRHVIAAMDDRISQLRAGGMPDAAGLVLASDQDDARAYADVTEEVTGRRPVLVLSDDPQASSKITAFAGSDERIAVCVRMVTEGVDIVRAACLAWLTSYRTPLFFAQAVGRVVRSRRPGESATVFLPAVRPVLALAAELETERDHVLAARKPGEDIDLDPPPREDGGNGRDWEAVDAEATFAHVLHGGRAVVAQDQPPASEGAPSEGADTESEDFLGLPGLLSPEQTATLLARRDREIRARHGRADTGSVSIAPEPAAARPVVSTADLRREVNQLVGRVAARTGAPHATVHARLRAEVPGPASASAAPELLARRRDHLLALL